METILDQQGLEQGGCNSSDSYKLHIDSVKIFDDFRALKSSLFDDFRALKFETKFDDFRALKSSFFECFRALKSSIF